MAETAEVPTREQDLATVNELLGQLSSSGRRRTAAQALTRLLDSPPAPERDRYAVLAEARRVLKAMASEHLGATHGTPRAGAHGMAYQACEVAEDAIFEALNTIAHHCDDACALGAIRA